MKILMISGLTTIAVLAAASMLRSHPSPESSTVGARMSSMQLQSAARPNELPVQDFEDRSLVFPRESAH